MIVLNHRMHPKRRKPLMLIDCRPAREAPKPPTIPTAITFNIKDGAIHVPGCEPLLIPTA